LSARVADSNKEIPKVAEIRKIRTRRDKADKALTKAEEAMKKFEDKHSPKLYASEGKEIWIIAGWAAS
jgi:hypothetical protein